MEALCCGLSTILSDISSYSQFSDAGEKGYAVLVPQRNPEATATELQKPIEGPAEARRALREAALRVAAEYDHKVANRRFARAMEEIAAR
jgi:glycosyltransferase involved in cell wall biosynthesis